jgi:hypothetical protein
MVYIGFGSALALGDVRQLGEGDIVFLHCSAIERPDYARYWDALGAAWARGAEIRMIGERR